MRKRYLLLFLMLFGILAIYISNSAIRSAAKGKIFTDEQFVPYNRVGLLLGTGKLLANGSANPYYTYRIDAAKKLFASAKIKWLIISGDNSNKDYDEPSDMRRDLINAGIDSTKLFLDYAGFRTFDSMIRAREIFGQDSLTIISQQFHNERAIYIAGKEKIYAIGFNASDVGGTPGMKVRFREKLARVKVFVDYLFNTKPKFLGPRVEIR